MQSPTPRIRWAALAGAAALLASLTPLGSAALSPDPAEAAQLDTLSVEATPVASGLSRPTALAAPGDGDDRMLITEMAGTVRVYHPDDGLAEDALLDISDRVEDSGNEQGLLGIATPPDFARNPELYVTYTEAEYGDLVLSRFALEDHGTDPIDPADEEILLVQEHREYNNHNGGQLAFGGDGFLYWSMGDGGGAGDPLGAGQDTGTLLGSIVRLDVSAACGDLAYCVPEDNPFVGDPDARDEIWAYGLRNPWRFSFDPADGSLWIADVGQSGYEEINHLAAGEGGANLGWSCMEGPEILIEENCVPGETLTDPVFWYETTGGNCAVIGGQVYRGQAYADVAEGVYFFTDYCSGDIWGLQESGGAYDGQVLEELPVQITTMAPDADGELYAVNDLPGQLYTLSFDGEPIDDNGDGGTGEEAVCAVEYSTDEWNGGFVASLQIANTGEEAIEGWTLEFDFPGDQEVLHGWSADWSQDGSAVTAADLGWNAQIAPGDSVDLGFQGSWSAGNPAPEEFTLNGSPCTAA